MGCGSSQENLQAAEDDSRGWHEVAARLPSGVEGGRRMGNCVRLFVSSTQDFESEREVLAKEVLPALRAWCRGQGLCLLDCDLQWGASREDQTAEALWLTLDELDRGFCHAAPPFFVALVGLRAGWVPLKEDVLKVVRHKYRWIDGFSRAEMEIMHGAYRPANPRAIFMFRTPDFIESVPSDHRHVFLNENPIAHKKLQVLKKAIVQRFQTNQMVNYTVEYAGFNEDIRMPQLKVSEVFAESIIKFVQQRIISERVVDAAQSVEPYEEMKQQQEALLKRHQQGVVGRDRVAQKLQLYVQISRIEVPMLLLGELGSGKTSVLAQFAASKAALDPPNHSAQRYHVFCHFLGLHVPATDLRLLLVRLVKELSWSPVVEVASDLGELAYTCRWLLASANARPVLVIVDGLDQLYNRACDLAAESVSWIPNQLSPQVRLILSATSNTLVHKALMRRNPRPLCIEVPPLTPDARQDIIDTQLYCFHKRIEDHQRTYLLTHPSSGNPLWLSLACNELWTRGPVIDKLCHFAAQLRELEEQIVERLQKERQHELVIATLCMLEASCGGLLEVELLTLLQMPSVVGESMLPPILFISNHLPDRWPHLDPNLRLPSLKWAAVYSMLKPFLRPPTVCGHNRLLIEHCSVKQMIQEKFFLSISHKNISKQIYRWWHSRLAGYFEHCPDLDRQLEEYPEHLTKMGDRQRLREFLCRRDVLEAIGSKRDWRTIVRYWEEAGGGAAEQRCPMETLVAPMAAATSDAAAAARLYDLLARMLLQSRHLPAAERCARLALHSLGSDSPPTSGSVSAAALYYLLAQIEESRLDENASDDTAVLISLVKLKDYLLSSAEQLELLLAEKSSDRKACITMAKLRHEAATTLISIMIRGGCWEYPKATAKVLAFELASRAASVFCQVGDDVLLAEARSSIALCSTITSSDRLQMCEQAQHLLVAATGHLHPLLDRIYFNAILLCEELADFNKAYEYLRRWHMLCVDVFGLNDARTKSSVACLNEPRYVQLAHSLDDAVPQLPTIDTAKTLIQNPLRNCLRHYKTPVTY